MSSMKALDPEHFLRGMDGIDQSIHLACRVVQVHARASRRRHAEPRHERLVAVMSRAHAHSLAIEDRRELVPASNFHGSSFHSVSLTVTRLIMSPPYRNGRIFSSISARPQSPPEPGG